MITATQVIRSAVVGMDLLNLLVIASFFYGISISLVISLFSYQNLRWLLFTLALLIVISTLFCSSLLIEAVSVCESGQTYSTHSVTAGTKTSHSRHFTIPTILLHLYEDTSLTRNYCLVIILSISTLATLDSLLFGISLKLASILRLICLLLLPLRDRRFFLLRRV